MRRLSCAGLAIFAMGAVFSLGATPAAADSRMHAQAHLGPNGMAKCRAFRNVMNDTQALQKIHHGSLPTAVRLRLERALKKAKAMPPSHLAPEACGVPL